MLRLNCGPHAGREQPIIGHVLLEPLARAQPMRRAVPPHDLVADSRHGCQGGKADAGLEGGGDGGGHPSAVGPPHQRRRRLEAAQVAGLQYQRGCASRQR